MVRTVAAALALLTALPSPADTQRGCRPGTDIEPPTCTLKLPRIANLRIDENAATVAQAAGTPEAAWCPGFAMSQRSVRRYLSGAKQVPAETDHSLLDWTPCYAAGEVRFVNGQVARWHINLSRVATLSFVGKPDLTLYCPRCNFSPFSTERPP